MSNNIIAFIPARSGSKSISDKNIKLLGGKPLMVWSIQSALESGFQRVIVSTDSKEYVKIARKWGADVLIRPQSLAGDKTSMLEVLQHEVPRIEPKPDFVFLMQATNPFRKKQHIKLAISMLVNYADKYDSVISVERVPEKWNPYAMILETGIGKGIIFSKLKGMKQKISSLFTGKKYQGPLLSGYPISERMTRRQDLPPCWLPTGSVYLFKTENLSKGSIYGERVMLLETEPEININSQKDFQIAVEFYGQHEVLSNYVK